MKKPRFTDLDRYGNGYKQSCDTDVTRTWERAKKRMELDKAEREEKVRELKHLKGGAK